MAKSLFYAAAFILGFTLTGSAQDTHYWTQRYGTRSTLLGGVVIGSPLDMSATFYNPGGLSLVEDPAFILSGAVYEITRFQFDNAAGEGQDLSSLQFRTAPDLFAGLITFNKLNKTRLAYSFLTRQRLKIRLSDRFFDQRDALPRLPGLENFGAEALAEEDLNEDWAGLTVSHRFDERSSVGITQYVAIRNHRRRNQIISQAQADDAVASTISASELDYYHWRTLWKIGISFDLEPLTFGLSLTTPSIALFGSGSVLLNRSLSGQDVDGDGEPETLLAYNFQKGLKSNFKSSWAVGIGGAYNYGRSTIHVSAEWYNAVKQFEVVEADEFEIQSIGETVPLKITHQLGSVLNFGVGIEHPFSEKFSGFGSFITDFSAAPPSRMTDDTFTNWDLYHITTGGRIRIPDFELTLGLGFAFGKGTNRQLANFPDADESNGLIGRRQNIDSFYRRLIVIFGFSFHI